MLGDTDSIFAAFGSTAAATNSSPLNDVATMQTSRKKTPAPIASPTGDGSDVWSLLQQEYGKVDDAFSTTAFDKAAEEARGNIITASEQSANSASAEYMNRARQQGGTGEGAGLVKAEALVTGRRTAEDVKLKQFQFDIQQKEAARQLASEIASHIGSLRMDYLKNLTSKEIAQMNVTSNEKIAQMDQGWHYASINAGLQEAAWAHPMQNPAYQTWQSQNNNWSWMHPYGGVNPYANNRPSMFTYPTFTPYGG